MEAPDLLGGQLHENILTELGIEIFVASMWDEKPSLHRYKNPEAMQIHRSERFEMDDLDPASHLLATLDDGACRVMDATL